MGHKPRSPLPTRRIDSRARLRPLRRGDRDALFAAVDADRARLRRWLPWVDAVRDPPSMQPFIDETERLHRSGGALRLLIEVDGQAAGVASLESIDRAHRKAFIGYWIHAAFEGRGYVSAAVRELCRYGFVDRGLHRIELLAAPGNRRSRAIPERLGFSREGVLRDNEWLYDRFEDSVVYSLLRHEWEMPRQDCHDRA